MDFCKPRKHDGSDHTAALRALVEAVGTIDVSKVELAVTGLKSRSQIIKQMQKSGTGRSLVAGTEDWVMDEDEEDFGAVFAKSVPSALGSIEEQKEGISEADAAAAAAAAADEAKRKAADEAAAKRKADEEAAAKLAADLQAKAEAAAKAAAEAQAAADAAAKAAADAATKAQVTKACESENPDEFGALFGSEC